MRTILAMTVLGVMLLGSCGDDSDDAAPDTPATDETDTGSDDDSSSNDDSSGSSSGNAMGTATIDGVVYEFPDVRDCGLGDSGFPNDRDFVGYSADGEVVMSVGYFEDESLAGLNSISVEIDEPHALYSSQYAPDGEFVIDVLPNGAEGNTTVGAVGIEVSSGDREATWSFTC
ncbi:MAG: hypothetical protein U5K29_06090 [Acidimicrobiales bacterium]|nr:hypothetical protein [Acidimicrobiales bacterium]